MFYLRNIMRLINFPVGLYMLKSYIYLPFLVLVLLVYGVKIISFKSFLFSKTSDTTLKRNKIYMYIYIILLFVWDTA